MLLLSTSWEVDEGGTVILAGLTKLIRDGGDSDLVDDPDGGDVDELLFLPGLGRGATWSGDLLGDLDAHLRQLIDVLLLLDLLEVALGCLLAILAETGVD